MDVQTAGLTLGGASAATPSPEPAPVTPQPAPVPKVPEPVAQSAGDAVSTLKEPLEQILGSGAGALEISFRVEHAPNMIVTVLRDSKTGEEISQYPPEVIVQIAQAFEKNAGAVVDRSA